jgi:hypothetical protein
LRATLFAQDVIAFIEPNTRFLNLKDGWVAILANRKSDPH